MDNGTKKTARKWTLNFITVAFSIALALLFILVLRSIAVQITPPPEIRNIPYPDTSTPELCEQAGGTWIARQNIKSPAIPDAPTFTPEFCQGPLKFEREQDIQRDKSQQTSLFVFAIGGAIAVAVSLLVIQLKPIAPGLMIGGIVAFFISGIHIWNLSPGIGRLVTIIAIFIILTGIGLHVFKDQK